MPGKAVCDGILRLSIYKIQNESTILIAPETMKKKVIIESGIVESNCIFYQPGTVHELGKLWIETVPAYNRIKPFHPKVKKWQGYVVQMDGVRYYVAGDTDVNEDIKKVKCYNNYNERERKNKNLSKKIF